MQDRVRQLVASDGYARLGDMTDFRESFAGVPTAGGRFRIDQAMVTDLRDGKVAEAWEIADAAALQAHVAPG